jgi:hypothetical protein
MSFNEKKDSQEKSVFKGFLFQSNEGQWILSKNPDLKSCCIGKMDPDSFILLDGDFSSFPTDQLITAKGILRKEPAFLCNQPIETKFLTEIEITRDKEFPALSLSLLVSVLLILLFRKQLLKVLRLLLP